MNYVSINSKPQHLPRGARRCLNFWKLVRQISTPGANIVLQYPTQVLDLMVNLFLKGKMSDPDIPYTLKKREAI